MEADKNKEVALWIGINEQIDFSNGAGIIRLLVEMMKHKHWPLFVKRIGARIEDRFTGLPPVDFIHPEYMAYPNKLLEAVHSWSKEHPR